jgi:DNA-binding transcriptional LysR family regulator
MFFIGLITSGNDMDVNLNFNQLWIFHTTAEEKSFTRAAVRLHLTQPGVSKHIKGLEEYFGTPLFDRIGRRPALTTSGEILYEATQRIFDILRDSRERMNDLESNNMGQLRIGASITLGIYILLPYVKQFKKQYPQIDLSMDISLSREVEENVEVNRLDLGFIGAPTKNNQLIAGKLFKDELVLVLPADHPWKDRKTVRISDIGSELLLVSKQGSGTRAILDERFRELGISPHLVELGHTESIKRAVETGLGISILSKAVVERELKMGWLKTIRLTGVNLKRQFYYVYRKDKYLSKAVDAFLSLIKKDLESRQTEAMSARRR